MKEKRRYYIDILRILACFAVIVNHFDPGFLAFSLKPKGSLSYWCLLFLSVFCKFAVPLFFMISGALLLHKTESVKTILTKRVSRILLSLIVASVFYYFFEKYIRGGDYAISIVYTNEAEYHLWYLYAYIAFLCSLPFLRSIAKEIDSERFSFLVVMYCLLRCFIPLFELFVFNNQYHLNPHLSGVFLCADLFFLPLLGFFTENKIDIDRISFGKLSFIWIVNILLLLLAMYATSLINANDAAVINQTYIGYFSPMTAFTLYITVKKFIGTKLFAERKYIKKIILSLSSCTFGIYLIHLMPMRLLNTNPEFWDFYASKGAILMTILWIALSAIIFILSYVVVWILRKIPVIKKIL